MQPREFIVPLYQNVKDRRVRGTQLSALLSRVYPPCILSDCSCAGVEPLVIGVWEKGESNPPLILLLLARCSVYGSFSPRCPCLGGGARLSALSARPLERLWKATCHLGLFSGCACAESNDALSEALNFPVSEARPHALPALSVQIFVQGLLREG